MFVLKQSDPVTHKRFPQVPLVSFIKMEQQMAGVPKVPMPVSEEKLATKFSSREEAQAVLDSHGKSAQKFGRHMFIVETRA